MKNKNIFIGILIGLLANFVGFIAAALLLGEKSLTNTLSTAIQNGFITKLVSLGAVLNLLAFFIFIKKKQDYKARGVLIATILIAVGSFIYKVL